MIWDVIVIGAGPAGSTCAEWISKKGYSVALLEKEVPGKSVCAGGIGPRIYEGLKIPNNIIQRKVHRVNVYSNNAHISINLNKPNSTVYREDFDKFLANRAVENGASLFNNTKVTRIEGKIVKTNNGDFKGKKIVCADGVNSILNHMRKEKRLLALSKEYEIENVSETDYHIYYFEGLGPLGYGWLIPKKNSVTVGVLGFLGYLEDNISVFLDYLYKKHPICSKLCKEGTIKDTKAALIPYQASKKMIYRNIIGVGDAVGLTSPLTGGGIYYAYLSGKMAADFIALNLEIGHDLSSFEKEWKKTHGRSISLQWKLNVMLRKMWTDKGWDESLKKISENHVFSKNLAESWSTYKFENKSIWARMFLTIFYNFIKNKII